MARVLLENLVKLYRDKTGQPVRAVNGITLAVEEGEFMVLVGPSGCGKSTTLRMIAGLEGISDGTIKIGDRVVNDVLPKDRDIAMVFQNYALYPHMSVYENLAFGLRQRSFPKAEIEGRVREAATMLGIDGLLQRRPRELSGGQRQRVAVGRAIVRKPAVFLFDEPLSNLDAKMRGSTRTEISRLHARLGATMIYVTHDQVEAMTMGDRICVMKDGVIMQVAEPLTLYNQPANLFVAGFIGSPPMNLFRGALQRENGCIHFVAPAPGAGAPGSAGGAAALKVPLPEGLARRVADRVDGPLVLGIRPEAIAAVQAAPGPASAPLVAARVEVAEPMGAETYLYLTTAGLPFIARVRPTDRYEVNQHLTVAFDLEHAHLFDGLTEQALTLS